MKILHITPYYLPGRKAGGPIESVHNLCQGLAELGHEIHVFTTDLDGNENMTVDIMKPVKINNVLVWYFSVKFLKRFFYSSKMASELKQKVKDFSIVHVHGLYNAPVSFASLFALRNSVPLVISTRGMLVQRLIKKKSKLIKKIWLMFLGKYFLEKASVIHVTTTLEIDELKKFSYKYRNIVDIPNGLLSQEGSQDQKMSNYINQIVNGEPYILFLGRVSWVKGLDSLVESMLYIGSHVKLVIAGNDEDGFMSIIKNKVKKFQLEDRVAFTGAVYENDKKCLIQNALFLSAPSLSENFGMSVLEAMSQGCAVAVSKGVGISSYVKRHRTGVILPSDPKEMGLLFSSLIARKRLLKKMGNRGRVLAKNKFSVKIVSENMARVYQGCLSNEIQAKDN